MRHRPTCHVPWSAYVLNFPRGCKLTLPSLNRRDVLRLAAAAAASTLTPEAHPEAQHKQIRNLPRRAMPAASRFAELPVGSVRPQGWLLTQLQAQADGITGHLHHLYAPFTGDAWTSQQADPATEWVPWEVRAYWCDGALRCGLLLNKESLVDDASRLVKYTFAHPQSDGYLGPLFLKVPGDYHRWPHNVFFRAAMAWHTSTGDPAIVDGLHRHYLQSPFVFVGARNQTNIEAMLWTFDQTGDPRLLQLAKQTWELSQTQFSQMESMQALTEQAMLSAGPVKNMHGVTYAEHSKLPLLLYRATGEEHYLKLALAAQQKVFDNHLLVSGGPSSTECLSTATARDAHESCDLADYPWTWGYLLMGTGDGSYGDRIERVMFNAFPGALRKDWKALQYYSSPNQFLCTAHSDHLGILKGTSYEDIREYRYMQRMSYRPSPGYSVVCCPANVNRILPNFIIRMWMQDHEHDGLAATLYGPCKAKFQLKSGIDVEIEEETSYPYSDRILFHIKPQSPARFPLHLRIPAWCASPKLLLNKKPFAILSQDSGFVTLLRVWQPGDLLELRLPMVTTTTGWPEDGLSIERGPLVYAHPITEQWKVVEDDQSTKEFPAWDLTPTGKWNYALSSENVLENATYNDEASLAASADSSPSSPINPWMHPPSTITVQARQVAGWALTQTTVNGEAATFTPRLPDATLIPTQISGAAESLTLVPYGCTELRVAVFPHLKADPGKMPG